MEHLILSIFFLFAVFAFVYYPAVFLISFTTILIYVYLVYEGSLNQALVDRTQTALHELPSFEEFTRTKVRHLMALIYDGIICREEPTTPLQILQCKHIFCEDCFFEWLSRGHRRCPQCTQILFHTISRTLEKLTKLLAAMTFVALPLTLLNLAFGPLGRVRLIIGTTMAHFTWELWRSALKNRRDHGIEWWRHRFLVAEDGVDDEERERIKMNAAILLCSVVGIWIVFQSLSLEKWVPAYFLWKILCQA